MARQPPRKQRVERRLRFAGLSPFFKGMTVIWMLGVIAVIVAGAQILRLLASHQM